MKIMDWIQESPVWQLMRWRLCFREMKSSAAIFWLRVFPASPWLPVSTFAALSSHPLIRACQHELSEGLHSESDQRIMNQAWELIWLKKNFKTLKSNPDLWPLGKVKPTTKSLWLWNPWTDASISQSSGRVGDVPIFLRGGPRDGFRNTPRTSPAWRALHLHLYQTTHATKPSCAFTFSPSVHAHSGGSLKLDNRPFKGKRSCSKSWLLARIPSLQQVWNQKGVMAKQVAICWKGCSCQRKSLNRRNCSSIKGSKMLFSSIVRFVYRNKIGQRAIDYPDPDSSNKLNSRLLLNIHQVVSWCIAQHRLAERRVHVLSMRNRLPNCLQCDISLSEHVYNCIWAAESLWF